MSWDRDRLSSTSSSSSPSSSSLPSQSRVRSTGLPSLSTIDQTDSSGERLRLPPLSSLISGSSSQYPGAALAPPQAKDVPRGAARTADPGFSRPDWSPLAYNQGSRFPELNHSPEQQQASSPQRSEDPYRPSHHNQHLHRFHQEHGVVANEGQQQHYVASQPAYPSMQGFRRSNSTSSSSAQSVSLPPLTSLSIKTSSRSPSLASASLTDREMAASRHNPSIYSLHRSPFPPSSPSSKHSIGPSRRRWTGGSSSHTPYDRPSPPTDAEHFDQIWDIYSYACRVNDEASDAIRQSYPTIAHLDLKALLHHLHRELDELDRHNPRLGMQLAQDAGLAGPIKPSHLSPATSPASASLPYHQHGWMNAPRAGTIEGPLSASREGGGGAVGPNSSTASYFDRGQLYRRNSRGESSSSSTTSPPLARVMPGHPSSYHQQHSLPSISPGGMKSAGVINPIYSPLAAASSSSSSAVAASSLPPKRVRKRKDEAEQSCLSCSATETPEWRKGPTGPRTLCNACGLLFAKQCRKKELDAQTRGERPKGSRPIAPEIMSAEEKERSLAELKIAVNARAANISPPI